MNIPQHYIALGIIAIGVSGFFMTYQGTPAAVGMAVEQQIKSVPAQAFAEYIDNDAVVLLDIRTPEEYDGGHIEGAANIDFYAADFDTQLAKLDRDVSYAIYCRSGNRTGQTLSKMRKLGFTNVVDLTGGIVTWEQAGKELVY
ncbi:rhodanese-like domain-containing protein [Candidatus Nomurabacteria bacterium]|nr:rhodanese-like domain-containing protein [Candidatus Nomurabacteria bacterium]